MTRSIPPITTIPPQLFPKIDTAANFTSDDPTLLNGQTGYESDTGRKKIGDGTTAWTSLPYVGASADWINLTSAFAYKTADTSRASTTTHADDPHLVLNLTAGSWEIKVMQAWQSADGTAGMKARLNYTGTWVTADSWLNYRYFHSSAAVTETTGAHGYVKGSSLTNPQALFSITTRSGFIVYEGQIKVSTSGILSLQWAQNASTATATILPQGAYILARRVA